MGKRLTITILLTCFLFTQGCVSLIILGVAAKKRSDRRKAATAAQTEKPAETQNQNLQQEGASHGQNKEAEAVTSQP